MSEQSGQFEDPALKAAIYSALSREVAPAQLRRRISELMDAQMSPRPLWRHRNASLYAIAATLLIVGLGVGLTLTLQSREDQIPSHLANAMVEVHDKCKAAGDHHLLAGVSDSDVVGMRKQLRELLGHPALVAMLGRDWKFKGAGICEVEGHPTAHLLFARGDETVSIFSVSEKLLFNDLPKDGSTFSQTVGNHELAGFVYGGAVHFLVGDMTSRKLTLGEMINLREALRTSPAGWGPQNNSLRVAH
ncbi:MAG TPA: hypothetical protein VHD56_10530 [Tepidisphaeraceae bacterium]|nr:hypothetical protein [Tepidisphaeraceae bacterium]